MVDMNHEPLSSKDYGEKEMKQHKESMEREKRNYFSGAEEGTEEYT